MSRRRCYVTADGTILSGGRKPPTAEDLATVAAFREALEAAHAARTPEERAEIEARYAAGQDRIAGRRARILGR